LLHRRGARGSERLRPRLRDALVNRLDESR
jgi:hypothetical protein